MSIDEQELEQRIAAIEYTRDLNDPEAVVYGTDANEDALLIRDLIASRARLKEENEKMMQAITFISCQKDSIGVSEEWTKACREARKALIFCRPEICFCNNEECKRDHSLKNNRPITLIGGSDVE